jgi:probable addiction module antidote protein
VQQKKETNTDNTHDTKPSLREAAEAKGWSAPARETGLSRSLLHSALSGKTDPRIGTVMKILKALCVRVLTNIVPFGDKKENQRSMTKNGTEEAFYG